MALRLTMAFSDNPRVQPLKDGTVTPQNIDLDCITLGPSDLFQRNCWIAIEPVEGSLNVLAEYIGPNKILWATDYPHPDGFFPGAPKMIADRPELSDQAKRGILAGGDKALYKLA